MLGTKKAAMALILAVPLLGACQTVFGGSRMTRTDQQAQPATPEAEYAAAQIAQGRKALDEGQPGAAVTAFRNAKQFPEQAAAASNGLAIAYSQLGRSDLAERYFRAAMALAPGERKYQVNLQRFYQAQSAQLARSVAAPAPAPWPASTRVGPIQIVSRDGSRTGLTVSRPASRLARLSPSEVRIGSDQPASDRPRTAAVSVASKPGQPYPVRLSIRPREVFVGRAAAPPRSPAKAVVASSQDYPVRVQLKAAQ